MTTDVSYNTGNWHVCLKLKYTSTASYRPKTNISTAENWDRDSHNSLSTFRRHPRMHDKAKFSITVIWCQKKNVRNGEWDSYAQAQGQKPTLLSINRLTSSKKINRTLSKMLTKWSHWLMYMLTWYVWHHSKNSKTANWSAAVRHILCLITAITYSTDIWQCQQTSCLQCFDAVGWAAGRAFCL